MKKKKAYNKKYRANNKDILNAKKREYYAENKKEINAKARENRANKRKKITPAVEKAENELKLRIQQMKEGSKALENGSSTSVTPISLEEKNDKELLNLYGDNIEEISLGDISTNADTGNDAGINLDFDGNSQIPKIIEFDDTDPIVKVVEEELEKLSEGINENSTDLQQNDSSGSSQDFAAIGGLPINSDMKSNTARKPKSDTSNENKRTANRKKGNGPS